MSSLEQHTHSAFLGGIIGLAVLMVTVSSRSSSVASAVGRSPNDLPEWISQSRTVESALLVARRSPFGWKAPAKIIFVWPISSCSLRPEGQS